MNVAVVSDIGWKTGQEPASEKTDTDFFNSFDDDFDDEDVA